MSIYGKPEAKSAIDEQSSYVFVIAHLINMIKLIRIQKEIKRLVNFFFVAVHQNRQLRTDINIAL